MSELEKQKLVPDKRRKSFGSWAAGIFSVLGLAFLGLSVYIVVFNQAGRFDLSDKVLMPVAGLMFLLSLASFVLIRKDRYALGAGILFGVILIPPVLATLVLTDFILVSILFIVVFVPVLIFMVLPGDSRRWTIPITVIMLIAIIGIEIWDPPFRFNASIVPNFVYVVAPFAALGLLAFTIRQAFVGNIRTKLVTSFTVVALISVSIVGVIVYNNHRKQVREDIRQRLLNIISITALQQDGDLHATLQMPDEMQSKTYLQMKALNDSILATDRDLEYIYTMRMNEEGQIYFVLDSGLAEGYESVEIGLIYEEPSELLVENFVTLDHPIVEEDFYTDFWGTFLSAYAPIYRSDGVREGVIGVDIAADKVLTAERQILRLIIGTAVSALVIVTIIGLILGNLYTRPITKLAAAAQKIAEGDLSVRAEVESSDEIGELTLAFNTMTTQLQQTLGSLEQQVFIRTRALETSTEVSRRLSTILDLDQLVREVVEQLHAAFGYYHAQIYLFDERKQYLLMSGGTGEAGQAMLVRGHKIQRGLGLVGQAAETNQLVLISDVSQEEDWLPNPLLPETKTEVAVPIAIGPEVLGVLDVQHNVVDGLTEQDANLIQAIANQVAIAVQNARAYQHAQRQAAREAQISAINQRIQTATTIEDVLKVAVSELGEALGAEHASVELKASTLSDGTQVQSG